MSDTIPTRLQENILTLLCFSTTACPILSSIITIADFNFIPYQTVATYGLAFYNEFKAPAKDHIADLLEKELSDPNTSKIYTEILERLYFDKDEINETYILSQLSTFVRQQSLSNSIVTAAKLLHEGNLEAAEIEIEKGRSKRIAAFDPGTQFSDTKNFLSFLDEEESFEAIPTGIDSLDVRGICPRRKEFILFEASAKKGKTWWLIHLVKHALLARKKVLVISLELSEKLYARRITQAMFSYTRRKAQSTPLTLIEKDSLGRAIKFTSELVTRPSLTDEDDKKAVRKKVEWFAPKMKLIIKQFPTSSLTINGLKAYLAALEGQLNFTPDLLVLDYADLMSMDIANLRLETGQLYKELRGLSVERNMALASASQGNRESETAKLVTQRHLAEDWSKVGTVDTLITYSQTPQEYAQRLARLFVAAARSEEDKFLVLISQAYSIGQFCVDSALMSANYWEQVDASKSIDKGKSESEDQ